MTQSILLIEDESNIQTIIKNYLEVEGFTVHIAADGEQGLSLFRRHKPILVILDILLPKLDGLQVLSAIRQMSEAYVIMLTAKSEETDRIVGLTIGADDYMTKPFSPRELVARVKAVLRRQRDTHTNHDAILIFDKLRIDSLRHEVWRDDVLIELTALEFKLLFLMAQYAGMVMNRQQIIQKVWGYDFFGDERIVAVHIGNIRQKLEADPSNPVYIKTVRGVGYKFEG